MSEPDETQSAPEPRAPAGPDPTLPPYSNEHAEEPDDSHDHEEPDPEEGYRPE